MNLLDLFWHLAGFVAPAWALALGVVGASWFFMRNRGPVGDPSKRFATNFAVNVLVLVAGLVLTGQDGRLITYAALVLASATCEWVWVWRASRRRT